jgi:hypothetical protein
VCRVGPPVPCTGAVRLRLWTQNVQNARYGARMDTTSTPWEPPFAGTEEQALLGALDRLRATFRWKTDGLDSQGLRATVGASSLTLASLLKHLAVTEDHHLGVKLDGGPMDPVWADNGWDEDDDWELTSAVEDPPEKLYDLYDGAVARARSRVDRAIREGGLDGPVAVTTPTGEHANLRRLLLDMVEEYGRHTGHADLLREAVDGRTGEDPPAGWQPVSGDGWRWPQR